MISMYRTYPKIKNGLKEMFMANKKEFSSKLCVSFKNSCS